MPYKRKIEDAVVGGICPFYMEGDPCPFLTDNRCDKRPIRDISSNCFEGSPTFKITIKSLNEKDVVLTFIRKNDALAKVMEICKTQHISLANVVRAARGFTISLNGGKK